MTADLFIIPAVFFVVAMVGTYLAGCLAHGYPLTPWFARSWMRALRQRWASIRARTKES